MIKEENQRMLKQVEDVLRISQLERGTLMIEKKVIKLNDVIKSNQFTMGPKVKKFEEEFADYFKSIAK